MRCRIGSLLATALVVVVAALGLAACRGELWNAPASARAQDADVAAALGDTSHQNSAGLAAEDIPRIAYPRALRPCCAFGMDLRVQAGSVPIPGVELGNLVDPKHVGAHRYDNGFISISASDSRSIVDDEGNGLVYTCRGGFIDLAHVRDNADNTLAIAAFVARHLETGGILEVPSQGATMRLRIRPVSESGIERYGRLQLAVALAEWLAYQLSIWHEIATFYGYASLAAWPEKISAFSPEDLYSNQIGGRIAGGVILSGGAGSNQEWGLEMDAWIQRTLERLGAVELDGSRQAMHAVDGLWWDSSKRVPDWTLVKRRQFETGPFLPPWRLEDATSAADGEVEPLAACREMADDPLVLHVKDGFAGALFRDYGTVELEVDDLLAANGFPFPDPDSRTVTQADFPAIIAAAHEANAEQFGPGADGP